MAVNPNIINFLVYTLTAVIIAMLIVSLLPKNCEASQVEGFVTTKSRQTPIPGSVMFSCPQGTKSFIDRNGNTNCCRGSISGSKCEGKVTCTLSSGASKQFPICRVPPPPPKPRTIKLISNIGVGKNGTLYSSSNLQNWTTVYSGPLKFKSIIQRPYKLEKAQIVGGELLALGTDGKVYQGSDDGKTWSINQSYKNFNLKDMIQKSSTSTKPPIIYSIGTGGKLYIGTTLKTTNMDMDRLVWYNNSLHGINNDKLYKYNSSKNTWDFVISFPYVNYVSTSTSTTFLIGKDYNFYNNTSRKLSSTLNPKQLQTLIGWTIIGR